MADAGDVLVHLMAWKLTTLTGFGTLRHLDLEVVGVDQIFRRHAKAARRNLLDGRALGIAVWQGLVAIGFFAALAGVGLSADAVHGNGERGVRLT